MKTIHEDGIGGINPLSVIPLAEQGKGRVQREDDGELQSIVEAP